MSVPPQFSTTESWSLKKAAWVTRLNELNLQSGNVTTDGERSMLLPKYKELYGDIFSEVSTMSENETLENILKDTAQLQTQIQQLHRSKKEMNVDVESAIARDEALRSRDIPTNPHALFLLNRPVRRNMIPYLWAIGVLFIGITIYIWYVAGIRMDAFPIQMIAWSQITAYLYETLLSRTMLLAIIGACVLTILVFSLKVGGVF